MKNEVTLPGFKTFSNSAQKFRNKKSGRLSGGIILGYKYSLDGGISFVKSNTDYLWCKLDKVFFNLEKDIYLCAIYIPPRDSPYFNPDVFVDIESDIAVFTRNGSVMLAGDFNARTSKVSDFIDVDNCNHIPGDNIPLPDSIKKRQNYDNNINDHGKSLIELCKTCDLRILNGRTKGDSFGKITYHSQKGVSTVDYIIVSHDILNLIESFIVKKPNIFSDHSQLICWTKVTVSNLTPLVNVQQHKKVNLPKQYIWDEFSKEKFADTFQLNEIQSQILLFENSIFEENDKGIDHATTQFTQILDEVSKRSLKLTCQKNSKNNHTSKKWFDQECRTFRKYLKQISNKKHKHPHDTNLRNDYHQQNKTFKKLLRNKKQKFLDSKIDELISNKDSHTFWSTLKSMNQNKHIQNENKNEAPSDILYDHFKKLHSAPENTTFSATHLNVIENKHTLEQNKHLYNNLDNPISLNEIEIAILKKILKIKKHLDQTEYEMKC